MNYDYSPLTIKLTAADVEVYRKKFNKKSYEKQLKAVAAVIVVLFVVSIISVAIQQQNASASASITVLMMVLFIVGAIGAYIFLGIRARQYKHTRLARFAELNGMTFMADTSIAYSGAIFQISSGSGVKESLSLADGREVGNYVYFTGSGRSRHKHHWSYFRIKLVRKLPHMLLDAKKNNFLGRFSNLPVSLKGAQKLPLNNEFGDSFTIYAPVGYERDALYVFTPDVMMTLIKYGADYDIEVIDDNLFLYKKNHIKLENETELRRAFTLMDAIGKEVIEQGDYYADERVGDRQQNAVAPQGARLKKSFSWIVIVLLVVWFVYSFVSALLG